MNETMEKEKEMEKREEFHSFSLNAPPSIESYSHEGVSRLSFGSFSVQPSIRSLVFRHTSLLLSQQFADRLVSVHRSNSALIMIAATIDHHRSLLVYPHRGISALSS